MTEISESGGEVQADSTFVNEDGRNLGMYEPCEDSENSDFEDLDFELSDEEYSLLSYFPSELDFYDQKRGQILRRNGGNKKSVKTRRATESCLQNDQVSLSSANHRNKVAGGNGVCSPNKELRIKETRIENARRQKENKIKSKKVKGISEEGPVGRVGRKSKTPDPPSCLKKSSKKTNSESVDQTAKPPSFYNNSDFVLSSGNTVKFEDQAFEFMNLLIELQDRDITPEDYDLLLQLDCSVKPKTLSEAQIASLQSDTVTGVLDDVCSICIEDYRPGEERKFLPCGHYFHGQCIRTWLSWTSDRCPIDGKEVR